MISNKDKDKIMSIFKEVSSYALDCDDWVHIKKEVMKQLNPSLRKNCAACFSIEKDGEEQLVIAQEIRGEQNTQEIFYKIMERVSNEYSLIPYDIVFIKRGTISKTTSGKIQRQLSKKLYLEKKLEIISSLRQTIEQTKGSKLTLTAKDFVPLKTNIEHNGFNSNS